MQTINISIEAIDNGYILQSYVYGEDFGPVSTDSNGNGKVKRYFQDDEGVADAVATILATEL